ncbi:MAG TPA: helix-turn-helix transcriptional regulator [Candidatus Kapabacteria bacterium]|nr:helix-turn-helix transcriptional regulator [Candidatus Kapabacteria bacterium]
MMAKEALYREIGLHLRMIRDEIHLTMEIISQETGISRSYLSDFERGVKLPTSKYLKYLFARHNVNLNFVFSGEGNKFRPTAEETTPNFGKFQDEVDKLLHFMADMPHTLYAVLGFFTEYKMINKNLIEQHFAEKEKLAKKTG